MSESEDGASEAADDAEGEVEGEAPAVELGEGGSVEGAPLARIASRLTWPQERSEIVRKEGEAAIRTPDGPRSLESLLAETDVTYFATRQDFLGAVRGVAGQGPVPTE